MSYESSTLARNYKRILFVHYFLVLALNNLHIEIPLYTTKDCKLFAKNAEAKQDA